MCECYQVGGPFIAEDPDCPEHGTRAQARDRDRDSLRARIQRAETVEELRELMLELLDTI